MIPLAFFLIALIYSSVGFGGGSSYLAVLSLLLLDFQEIRTLALILNIVVVGMASITYFKQQLIQWRSFAPFLITSVPMAFIGAQFKLSESIFFLLLGGALCISAFFMWIQSAQMRLKERHLNQSQSLFIGAIIGLLSGLVGIGGGIFLAPTLNLLNWRNPRTIATLSAVFILVNSAAGLTGLLFSHQFNLNLAFAWPLFLAVLLGGIIGATWSGKKLKVSYIRNITALLVVYVGIKLILVHGFNIYI